MKITTKAVYNNKLELVYEECYQYEGELSLCGGKSSGSSFSSMSSSNTSTSTVAPTPTAETSVSTNDSTTLSGATLQPVISASESSLDARANQLTKASQSMGMNSTILTDPSETASTSTNSSTSTNASTLLG